MHGSIFPTTPTPIPCAHVLKGLDTSPPVAEVFTYPFSNHCSSYWQKGNALFKGNPLWINLLAGEQAANLDSAVPDLHPNPKCCVEHDGQEDDPDCEADD